jgi:hypothetical protein
MNQPKRATEMSQALDIHDRAPSKHCNNSSKAKSENISVINWKQSTSQFTVEKLYKKIKHSGGLN